MNQNRAATILVVDDEADHRNLISRVLSLNGFTVCDAADGIQGVELALQVEPDLIIMDLSMPVLDGQSAAEQIRRQPKLREVPIIFVSAFGAKGMDLFSGIDMLGPGPIEYLTKPLLDLDQMVELVNDVLNRSTPDGKAK